MIENRIRGEETEETKVLEFYLERNENHISLACYNNHQSNVVATITPSGKLRLEPHVASNIGLQIDKNGRILIED